MAEELYQRLFLYVFRLLSQPGLKRLTVETLAEQLAAPALAADDRRLLADLASLALGGFNGRGVSNSSGRGLRSGEMIKGRRVASGSSGGCEASVGPALTPPRPMPTKRGAALQAVAVFAT